VVADAMRQLSVEDRVVIYLSYYQGWTTSRIAANLELTEAAVQSQLHTGLGALRLALREMGVPA
jgi:RNA polymerase sigma-70 factor (ECF subfamily)